MSQAEQREEAIFEAALQLPADQRAAFLERECASDADLRRRVEVLLGAFERAGGFMKQPVSPERTARFSLPPTEKPGDKIGRYKLLEQIGEGGCGLVYVAEQEEPVRRRVALKVIKLGMDTKQVIARFDAERQALAMMDHPNIAKIHDAGVTETGRPYFVMELVRGKKITDYCGQNHLPPRERLDLFIQVCRAVQHAHQKGVIHRDIKPSNILVTLHDGVPVPKVIDFGIAKATQGRLTDQTLYTAFEQFIGTPAYMSPEQAEMSGLDIDTRSDIYSLGVLLYELLTGTTPFDAKELLAKGLDEMRRTIREVEPVKPSTRLTQDLVAADVSPLKSSGISEGKVRADSRRLLQEVRGDLDWIVMKCLEKDRTRRYETANGLATDISRHLTNQPVVARPPSHLYRFQKTVQRNKLAFSAATAVVLALIVGFSVSTALFLKEKTARERAAAAEKEQILLRQQAEAARVGEMKLRIKEESRARIAEALNLFTGGKSAEAEKLVDEIRPELVEPASDRLALHRRLGWAYAWVNRWTNAISNLMFVIQNDSNIWNREIALDHYYYSTALLIAGDFASYERYRQWLVSQPPGNNLESAEFGCRLVLLMPASPDFMRSLAPRAAMTFERSKLGTLAPDARAWNRLALATVAYRKADYTNTLNWVADCLSKGYGDPTVSPLAHSIRAMALHQMGLTQEAKTELILAKEVVEFNFLNGRPPNNPHDEGRWYEWQIARIALNEAEKTLSNPSVSGK